MRGGWVFAAIARCQKSVRQHSRMAADGAFAAPLHNSRIGCICGAVAVLHEMMRLCHITGWHEMLRLWPHCRTAGEGAFAASLQDALRERVLRHSRMAGEGAMTPLHGH